jgi:hypothetical protein
MTTEARNSPERERAVKAFESAGLTSKRVSRKNALPTRRADTLKMIFRDDAHKHQRISEADVLMTFDESCVTTVFRLVAYGKGGCYPSQVEREVYEDDYDSFDPEKIASYVQQTIEPYLS